MARITINLSELERRALVELGQIEERDPRRQAALIIRHELEQRGLLEPAQRVPLRAPSAQYHFQT